MKSNKNHTVNISSIGELHKSLGAKKNRHPLFSVHRYEDVSQIKVSERTTLVTELYQIALKKDCPGKLKYGQNDYDFDEGVLSFFAPNQINILEAGDLLPASGWLISFHPDFLNNSSLALKIAAYGFFDYATNEALIMSEEEENNMEGIFQNIEKEYLLPIDNFSQEVILNNLELMFTYSNRYYNRQFITRKPFNQTLLTKVELILSEYFRTPEKQTLPSAEYIASQLNLTPRYLSDCLKQLTGKGLQIHIHEKLIERAKQLLGGTELTISEIAYELGFEYPQSFHKLFKKKTGYSPLEYRTEYMYN
ncbi:helix-turn-helix domain-containing protein [Zhouia sp. PK063]|uniref:helix-turn-helix domain-containing protein n=1 Tax=Zhouia sp. PK063 TaxID=3373602 RepID=UPI0037AA814D